MTRLEFRDFLESGEPRRLRVDAGIRLVTLAEALGVSKSTLSDIERGITSRTRLPVRSRYLRVLRGLAEHERAFQQQRGRDRDG